MLLFNPLQAKESINTAIDEIRYVLRAHNTPNGIREDLEDAERYLLDAHDKIGRCVKDGTDEL